MKKNLFNKKLLLLIPILLFLIGWLFLIILGAKNPFETTFLILGTQFILLYIFLFIIILMWNNKYNKIILISLIIIFIGYNIIFFNNEGMDKVDRVLHNIKYNDNSEFEIENKNILDIKNNEEIKMQIKVKDNNGNEIIYNLNNSTTAK